MEFKDLIRKRRNELGLTMEELGKRIGVSKATIQRYESGEIKNVRRDKIAKLAKALEVTPSYLIDFKNEVKQENNIIFSIKLKQRREELKISQRELDKKIELSHGTIEMYESGKRMPTYGILLKLSIFLKISPLELLGWENIKFSKGDN